jgi:TPR repeat protein
LQSQSIKSPSSSKEQESKKLIEEAKQFEETREFERAADLYQRAADLDNLEAMTRLAVYIMANLTHLHGKDTAITLLQKASDAGNLEATVRLSACYVKGIGVTADQAKAKVLAQRAADGGNSDGFLILGLFSNHGDALNMYLKAADLGNVTAMVSASNLLLSRNKAQEAIPLLERAVRSKHPFAIVLLASLYRDGNGVAPNKYKAVDLYRQGAAISDPNSMHRLADCYYNGIGVEKNTERAKEEYTKAAERGYFSSICRLAKQYKGEIDKKKIVDLFTRCSDSHTDYQPFAMGKLGRLYYNGKLAPKDSRHAIRLLRNAVRLGDLKSFSFLQKNKVIGPLETINFSEIKHMPRFVRFYRSHLDALIFDLDPE